MKVFKFGGASVKDAQGVKNISHILSLFSRDHLILVISAMGKTTNHLEQVLKLYIDKENYQEKLEEIKDAHLQICKDLMPSNTIIFTEIEQVFFNLNQFFELNKSPQYDYIYDQVVSKGELLSTKIVSAYLNESHYPNTWLDARDYIKTDDNFREGILDWDLTCQRLNELDFNKLYVTQGFIGSDENRFTTTLGREGSDYTGAIIAYCINAESLTIWKDVPGVLNADPRYFENTIKLNHISYEEAIELSYYGASVIHPKTLQPLQHKSIPLYVKSFEDPAAEGTVIKSGSALEPQTPCYIVKKEQNVLHISTKDFSFIDEKVIRDVFNKFATYQIKVTLMQISAISLSLCIEDKFYRLEECIKDFKKDFLVELTADCTLFTIRYYTEDYKNLIPNISHCLIKQIRETTLQIVVKNEI
ncbi:aspartate kinase [Flavobacteriaceae bacterium Ap0902]|nr:aspartate kinase [Flavobacteriaceae bacterium Ap0902]